MKHKRWHVLSYDIECPKRGQRIHRRLRNQGVFVQKSVCLLHYTAAELQAEQAEITALMDPSADDLRIYPLVHPDQAWILGASQWVEGQSKGGILISVLRKLLPISLRRRSS